MPKVSFASNRRAAETAGLIGGGDYFKLAEGDNRVRLMSVCLPHKSAYNGKPTFKWLCYVIDRRDGKIKTFFMPHTIYKSIEALQANPDYEFDEVPMPYDMTIHAKGAKTKDVEYSIIPARKETPLTKEELAELASLTAIEEVQEALYEKANAKGPEGDEPPAYTDDEAPF